MTNLLQTTGWKPVTGLLIAFAVLLVSSHVFAQESIPSKPDTRIVPHHEIPTSFLEYRRHAPPRLSGTAKHLALKQIITGKTVASRQNGEVLLNIRSETWLGEPEGWGNLTMSSYTYDVNARLIEERVRVWFPQGWIPYLRLSYSYDEQDHVTTELSQVITPIEDPQTGELFVDTTAWVDDSRSSYTYDAEGNTTETFGEVWHDSSEVWSNSWMWTYTYDEEGRTVSEIDRTWDDTLGTWVNDWKISFTYDERGRQTTELDENWDADSGAWQNTWRTTYTYDTADRLTQTFYEMWIESEKSWVATAREHHSHNASGQEIEAVQEDWNDTTKTWTNSYKALYEYDDQERNTRWILQSWVDSTNSWVNNWRFTYRYGTPLVVGIDDEEELPAVYNLEQNYPNPFNPSTTIGFELPEMARVQLTVYDLLGRPIKTLIDHQTYPAGRHTVTFSADGLANGSYFYELSTSSETLVRRMMFVK